MKYAGVITDKEWADAMNKLTITQEANLDKVERRSIDLYRRPNNFKGRYSNWIERALDE